MLADEKADYNTLSLVDYPSKGIGLIKDELDLWKQDSDAPTRFGDDPEWVRGRAMYINTARTLIINVNKNDHLEIKLRTNLLSLKSSFEAFMWVLDDIEKATG